MEGKTCCVTGHRDLPQKEINHVKTALRREIDSAVADGFTRFMSGFADGVDQYFAEIVLEKKDKSGAGADCCHSLSKASGQPDGKGPDL